MKPLSLVLSLFLWAIVTAATSNVSVLPTAVQLHAAPIQDPASQAVYLTRTGEKYHRDGCRYLRQSRIPTTLRDAVGRGFGPCSVCKPPTP